MSFQAGDTIGDYEVVGLLGQGGMGNVYRVRNLIADRQDAMKVITPGAVVSGELADRFLREIRVHASLDHPNIAAFRTALKVENVVVMVMELVEGMNLEERLRQGPLRCEEAISYVDQVLAALSFAHERGVIHRDIKPANLILTPAGMVKITDFGIAHSAADPRLTATGMAVGSLYYMCPEQVKSLPVDGRSDLYSLGVTFYEMVTGRHPIRGESEYQILTGHLMQTPAEPSTVNPYVPAALSFLIMKALEKDPAQRFQSAEEFRQALRALDEPGHKPDGTTQLQPATGGGQGATQLRPATGSGSDTIPVPAGFDPDVLAKIEASLAPAIGPIARQLVLRTARRSASMTELCQTLAQQIPTEAGRQAFLRSCEIKTGTGPVSVPASKTPVPGTVLRTATGTQPMDAAVIQMAKEKLGPLIGPIAGVLVERTARKARTRREFVDTLAAEIASEADRKAFLASMG